MSYSIQDRAEAIRQQVSADPALGRYVDRRLGIPRPFHGSGPIKLVILGQDPTVKRASERAKIGTVLNLDRRGNLRRYLARICAALGLELDRHVYATNYVKNFFVRPPTQIEDLDVLAAAARYWLPLLKDELARLGGVPVISLGQPLLRALVIGDASRLVRYYWGYTPRWRSGEFGELHHLTPQDNQLSRVVFPFPHQPSIRKGFYRERMGEYLAFVRRTADRLIVHPA